MKVVGLNQTVIPPEVVVKRVVGRVGEVKAVTVTSESVGNALKPPEAVRRYAVLDDTGLNALLSRVRVKGLLAVVPAVPESPQIIQKRQPPLECFDVFAHGDFFASGAK